MKETFDFVFTAEIRNKGDMLNLVGLLWVTR